MKKIILNNILFILLINFIYSQFSDYTGTVNFDVSVDRNNYRAGEDIRIIFDFDIKNEFHIYSADTLKAPIRGETYTEYQVYIESEDSILFADIQNIIEPIPITKFDPNFNQQTSYHEGKFQLSQIASFKESIAPGSYRIGGVLNATACDPTQCIRVVEDFYFDIDIDPGDAREEFIFNTIELSNETIGLSNELKKETDKGFIPFILFSLGMGFLALLTPCVFPMIPITVSFFTKLGEKQDKSKEELEEIGYDINKLKNIFKSWRIYPITPLKAALVYALGIIIIFTLLGLILALTLGASGASIIATNPWINLLIGFLFIFFAFSLFGYYELQAPQFLTKYSLKQESKSGYTGILFMSLTFTLVSFTCTAALVGTLLVAASQGEYFWPIIGMISFATAFASPFFLLALFPQYLAKLPKSGGWLNSVKVIMGFLELAAAFKFISNSDLVWNWNIFDREVVLFIWVIIVFLIALYSLGFILFPHDTKPNKISFRRQALFSFMFIFGIYLSTGLFTNKVFAGNSLILNVTSGLVESYLPPPKSSSLWIEDLDLAYVEAKKYNKPIFLDFTGYTCTNCRWMEINIFEQKEVVELFDKFILVKLYTDGREEKHKRYRELEINRFKTSALPYYVVLNQNDEEILTFPGYNTDVELFKNFLKKSIRIFDNQ